MTTQGPRRPEELADDDREQLRRAHHRLRRASQELESLVAPQAMRGRWDPKPAPPEVLETVRADLDRAYRDLWRLHHDLLGWYEPEP